MMCCPNLMLFKNNFKCDIFLKIDFSDIAFHFSKRLELIRPLFVNFEPFHFGLALDHTRPPES